MKPVGSRGRREDREGVNVNLLAACGLYCGACYHYRASCADDAHLLSAEARGGRPLEGYTCRGCRSEQLYVHTGCRDCEIRTCVESRDLLHCGECVALPCERLTAFQTDGRKHHLPIIGNLTMLKDQGQDTWLQEQASRWQCSECATAFSWYEEVCQVCGAAVLSYGVDIGL